MKSRNAKAARDQMGFSLIELMIVVVIIVIVLGIAFPNIFRLMRENRLHNAGSEVANILQTTRFQAVRLNRNITARATCPGVLPVRLWVDLNNNGAWDPNPIDLNGDGAPEATEATAVLTDDIILGPGGAPGPGTMGPFYAATATVPNCGGGPGTGVTFNSRGVVNYGVGAPVVWFVTVGYNNQPQWGFRGVTLTPMGKTKLWKGTQGGAWVDR